MLGESYSKDMFPDVETSLENNARSLENEQIDTPEPLDVIRGAWATEDWDENEKPMKLAPFLRKHLTESRFQRLEKTMKELYDNEKVEQPDEISGMYSHATILCF